MIIITQNTHDELDAALHDTDFLVCSINELAYLQVDINFNRHSVSDIMDELDDLDVRVMAVFDDMSDEDTKDLIRLYSTFLSANIEPSEHEQFCLSLRNLK